MIDVKDVRIGIVGLGYVGLPLAVYMAQHFPVVGFDIDAQRDRLGNWPGKDAVFPDGEAPVVRRGESGEREMLLMRWGLFQGNAIGNAARDAYVRELDGTLLPRVAARVEERLGQFAPEPEKLFEFLKEMLKGLKASESETLETIINNIDSLKKVFSTFKLK